MNPAEYARMDAEESHGWWFAGKRLFLQEVMAGLRISGGEGPLLDAGCGTGATLCFFEELRSLDPTTSAAADCKGGDVSADWQTFGLDPSLEALVFARRKCQAQLICGSAERMPFADASLGTLLMLDVLEHLDDDAAALREARRVLRPGGYLALTVPAFPILWCDHDTALHHRRRYRRPRVAALLSDAGLQTLYLGHIFASVFPAAVLARLWRRLHPPAVPRADLGVAPPWINTLLLEMMRLESHLASQVQLPFGTSILAVARREM